MKYALIGCGRISPNHIAAAKANDLKFNSICDIVSENMEDKILKFELPETIHRYTDYRELLEKEKPELVAIATESGKHAAIALDCIAAGCNVIIEKPIALSIADADAIISAAKRRVSRYAPTTRTVLTSPLRRYVTLTTSSALDACSMALHTSAGTVAGNIIPVRNGAEHGSRMAER